MNKFAVEQLRMQIHLQFGPPPEIYISRHDAFHESCYVEYRFHFATKLAINAHMTCEYYK